MWNFGNLFWKLLGLSEASFQHGWLDLSLRSPKHFEISVKAFQRVLQRTKCPSVKFGNFSDGKGCVSIKTKLAAEIFRYEKSTKKKEISMTILKVRFRLKKP